MKGYKVTNAARSKICGIAASNLKELKAKAVLKFQVSETENYNLILLDGTVIDNEEYFQTLPAQSLLVLAGEHEEVITGSDIIYNALKAINVEYLRAGESIKQFFDENLKEKLKALSDGLKEFEESGKIEDKTLASKRKDHPQWFEGLETNSNTKEDFLKRRCKDRISGYFYKASSDLRKNCSSSSEKAIIESVITKLKKKLTLHEFNGGYFDRRAEIKLCDEAGVFQCQGIWNKERCLYIGNKSHLINPYRSREERIIFSTWNLDHRIEKSRTVIPCILTALRTIILTNSKHYDFNYDLIYSLLFTSDNLRLVHIVCHDKGAHTSASLQPKKVIIPLFNGFKKDEVLSSDEKSEISL